LNSDTTFNVFVRLVETSDTDDLEPLTFWERRLSLNSKISDRVPRVIRCSYVFAFQRLLPSADLHRSGEQFYFGR
jgi:hypothetical protein